MQDLAELGDAPEVCKSLKHRQAMVFGAATHPTATFPVRLPNLKKAPAGLEEPWFLAYRRGVGCLT